MVQNNSLADVLAEHQWDENNGTCACRKDQPTFGYNSSVHVAHQIEAVAAALDVDKIAEAIWQADEEKSEASRRRGNWNELGIWQDHYRRMAKAAIEAMKNG